MSVLSVKISNNVSLEEMRYQSAKSLYEVAKHEEIGTWLSSRWPQPYTLEDAEKFLSSDEVNRVYAIIYKGVLVGGFGVRRMDEDDFNCSASIGYWLTPKVWGRGIMTEVLGYVCDRIRAGGYDRVEVRILEENVASSRRCVEKIGFRLVGTAMKKMVKDGKRYNLCYYEWLR